MPDCRQCGQPIVGRGPLARTCSKACAILVCTQQRRDRKAAAATGRGTGICKQCRGPSKLSHVFCSRECQSAYAEDHPLKGDPTPEQIAERCAEVQATWSEREKEFRLIAKPTLFHVPGTV